MIPRLFHERQQREVIDAVLGILPEDRRVDVEEHLQACADCRRERDAFERTLAEAREDPARTAEPALDVDVLVARVQAEIDRRGSMVERPAASRAWLALAPLAAAAVLVGVVVLLRGGPGPAPIGAPEPSVSAETLGQLERIAGREQAARYLRDAQDVLVSVAVTLPRCDLETERRGVVAEAARSRELLSRRRLLVDDEAAHLAAARPVLEDVDDVLQEVASLEDCAGTAEVASITRRIKESRLLMKIDLVTRELQG